MDTGYLNHEHSLSTKVAGNEARSLLCFSRAFTKSTRHLYGLSFVWPPFPLCLDRVWAIALKCFSVCQDGIAVKCCFEVDNQKKATSNLFLRTTEMNIVWGLRSYEKMRHGRGTTVHLLQFPLTLMGFLASQTMFLSSFLPLPVAWLRLRVSLLHGCQMAIARFLDCTESPQKVCKSC